MPNGYRPDGPRSRLESAVAAVAIVLAVAGVGSIPSGRAEAAPSASIAPAPCNYYYEWIGKVRFPLQADPHATYTYVVVSKDAARDRVGFLVRGQFVHSVWTSWLTYTKDAQPFSGANFVGKDVIGPDAGSVDPFLRGQPMLGTPRNFTLLFEPKGTRDSELAASLDGTATAGIPVSNRKSYPAHGVNFWALANRDYQAFSGFNLNPGGSTKDTFPVVTAVDLRTGQPVDCQAYNLLPEHLQKPPTDPPATLNYGRVPIRIALRNGANFDLLGDLGGGGRSQFGPKNPRGLVQFSRTPLGPGADVSQVPPPQNCAGYLGTRTSTHLISLIRIPHIPNFTDTIGLTPSSTYPNPIHPGRWQAAYISLSMYGSSSGFYLPGGDPNTTSLADHEFNLDSTGGSTVLIWPRGLPKRKQGGVFGYAKGKGWAIVRGGTSGRQTSANVLFRVKAAAPRYYGATENVPCFFDQPQYKHSKAWGKVPVEDGSKWVATARNMGAAAPQGVTCPSIRALTSGECLHRLKRHIRRTGGRYFSHSRRHRGTG